MLVIIDYDIIVGFDVVYDGVVIYYLNLYLIDGVEIFIYWYSFEIYVVGLNID